MRLTLDSKANINIKTLKYLHPANSNHKKSKKPELISIYIYIFKSKNFTRKTVKIS
jgi:hypothetical protein